MKNIVDFQESTGISNVLQFSMYCGLKTLIPIVDCHAIFGGFRRGFKVLTWIILDPCRLPPQMLISMFSGGSTQNCCSFDPIFFRMFAGETCQNDLQ